MTEIGYFPPIEEYRAKRIEKRCAPVPLLPTPSAQGTFLPLFGAELAASTPGMSEPASSQTCSCPISDACILETFALLQGSLNLMREVCKWKKGSGDDARLGSILAEPCQLATIIKDLLPSAEQRDAPEATRSASLLLRRDSFLPTPAAADICSYVRQRLEDLLLDPVDTFAPIQHCIHVLLTLENFGSPQFRAQLLRQRSVQSSDEIDLMCQAYDHLARSSPKVYRSQFAEKVEALRVAIEDVAHQITFGADVRDAFTGDIVESVASAERFSFTTAKLISIPRAAA